MASVVHLSAMNANNCDSLEGVGSEHGLLLTLQPYQSISQMTNLLRGVWDARFGEPDFRLSTWLEALFSFQTYTS